jgi:hypothetical protein
MAEEEPKPVPSKGWAEMIRKVYEVNPTVCPQCGGTMKIVAFLTEYAVVDQIIDHLKLTFYKCRCCLCYAASKLSYICHI